MRTLIHGLLLNVHPDSGNRVFQGGSVSERPDFPFIVHRLSTTERGARRGRGRPRLDVWVYDRPGSYTRIDDILGAARVALEDVSDIRTGSEHIAQIDWLNDSPDLPAEEYGGIARMGSFTVVGGTA